MINLLIKLLMIAGQHQGAGFHTDKADREDSAQVARYHILVGR